MPESRIISTIYFNWFIQLNQFYIVFEKLSLSKLAPVMNMTLSPIIRSHVHVQDSRRPFQEWNSNDGHCCRVMSLSDDLFSPVCSLRARLAALRQTDSFSKETFVFTLMSLSASETTRVRVAWVVFLGRIWHSGSGSAGAIRAKNPVPQNSWKIADIWVSA